MKREVKDETAVSQQGPVQKDLGPDTEHAAARIQAYDSDESWTPSAD